MFRVNQDSSTERVVVRSGRRVSDRVEVLEGLRVGDQIVLRGFLGLSAGKKVQAVAPESGRS